MLDAVLAIVVLPSVILSICFAVEVAAGLRPLSGQRETASRAAVPAVLIIPAHNEEHSIAATVTALSAESAGIAELLVVADNCTDQTAQIARDSGARCIVRTDPEARGKGHALAFARDELAKAPPSVVLVIDADCRIDRASIAALIDTASAATRPVQAVNLLRPDLGASPFVQMSNFAFMLRNLVRQRGLQRLAKRVHLTGTGMAMPWPLFELANLGGSSIVEDLDLGVSMAARGHAPQLVEGANVWSPAAAARDTIRQRERWEGGFLKHALPAGLRGVAHALGRLDGRGVMGGLDLMIPPLTLLGVLNLVALVVVGGFALAGASAIPFLAVLIAAALSGIAVMVAWHHEGRPFASLTALATMPFYMLGKLPMYARILFRGAPSEWVRTDRPQ